MVFSRLSLLLGVASLAAAKDVYLDWNITWVWTAPDGFARPMIGINDQWPCPLVEADLGDRMIVDVHNGLGNQSTGLHWHGFRQYMTGTMDGSNEVTQCPLPPGSSMRYEFDVNQTGAYWYHSHEMGQYPDGLRGAFVVRDPAPPVAFDDEITITLTDHYHEQMPALLEKYDVDSTAAHPGSNEPIPDSALINETINPTFHVEPNKTYLVHLVCVGNFPGHVTVFEDHEISVVQIDGIWTDPYVVTDKHIRLATGQRMSVLLRTKDNTDRNYAIWDSMDVNMMFIYENRSIPEGFNPNATAWLVYDESKPLLPPPDIHELDPNNNFVDDLDFVPANHEPVLEPVDHQIVLDTGVRYRNGHAEFLVNGKTYIAPEEPTLYTALAAGPDNSSDPSIYGQVNPFVVEYGQVVEIVINNHHGNLHPWHLHGHHFQVLQRTVPEGGYFNGYWGNISSFPVQRDTIMVQNHGHAVIRFRADNPDKFPSSRFDCFWLIHCHIEWHVTKGLTATIIEAPAQMQDIQIPLDHQRICPSYGAPPGDSGEDTPGDETPGDDTSDNGTPDESSPDGEPPSNGTPEEDGPSGETPGAGTPYHGTHDGSSPGGETPGNGSPDEDGPGGETPGAGTPYPGTPNGNSPGGEIPGGLPSNPPFGLAPHGYPPFGGNHENPSSDGWANGFKPSDKPVFPGPVVYDSEYHYGGKVESHKTYGVNSGKKVAISAERD
ncbi:multicopper oxidase abr1 [Aspergillus clavatus NRRL 1]|uniref:Conidial pigment biosynthesis oxidase Abr1/brown 1 n=1 Tax=Aspergillus clavatus (strain ATCC 1007 / CBS 513.65 / DSM 816 / NCTC 3887 / NRRL 1 / QM 1276 / 107) TaxID=344612 RepID=A1C884_ASPCL|nr:conidial pigment biosynthesis oxidase Abr1/brown 1 [Aspergillus clavatus NRRL 1]EAW14605.1 conidial pigment biosynthesis oxidase Abr1/brown 1 [Aspergillus clavatus NRRL 1]